MVSDSEIRLVQLTDADREHVIGLDQAAFAFGLDDFDPELDFAPYDWDRTWGAIRPAAGHRPRPHGGGWGDGEELAGQHTVFTMQLSVPGADGQTQSVPMAGLSWVAVHPDHRRRGVLRAMMRHHLHGLHESGAEPISGLFASEAVIYQRFGYGEAAEGLALTLPSGTELRPLAESSVPESSGPESSEAASEVRTQLFAIGPDGELAEAVDLVFGRAANRPGWVRRPAAATRTLLRDRPSQHRGGEPNQVLLATRGERTTAYALLRRMPKWENGSANGRVNVLEVFGEDAASLHAVWTRVLSFDLMTEVETPPVGLDDPLLLWLVDVRAAHGRREDGLWLRLVDVDRALTARGYARDVDVVLGVEDELCPWNHRSWRLTVQGARVTCVPSEEDAELTVAVRDLGAAYLGGRSLAALARAGLVREHREGAVTALSAALRGSVGPVVPQMF